MTKEGCRRFVEFLVSSTPRGVPTSQNDPDSRPARAPMLSLFAAAKDKIGVANNRGQGGGASGGNEESAAGNEEPGTPSKDVCETQEEELQLEFTKVHLQLGHLKATAQ